MTEIVSAPRRRRRKSVRESQRSMTEIRDSLAVMREQLNSSFVDRAEAINVIQLALITGMNYLLVGDPGTAKTALAQAAAKHIVGASYFAPSALGAYTTLGDLVGERDIPALMQGESRRKLAGRLADVNLAFLDEVFKSSDPTVNTLLSLANEREFEGEKTPLYCMGGASNWPEISAMKPIVRAMWDRWHFRCIVGKVSGDKALKALLDAGRKPDYVASEKAIVSLAELKTVKSELENIPIDSNCVDILISVYKRLEAEKIEISPRRLVQLQVILRANAWIHARNKVGLQDFEVLAHACWNKRDDVEKVVAVLRTVDIEAAQKIMKLINNTRALHQRFASEGWSLKKAHEFLTESGHTALVVADSLKNGSLSERSIDDIKRAARILQSEVSGVVGKFGAKLIA